VGSSPTPRTIPIVMTNKNLLSIGKYLSYILRHNPSVVGLNLRKGGWVSWRALVNGINNNLRSVEVGDKREPLTKEILDEVVKTNNKKRFEYSPDGTDIRARQGHSVEVDLGLEEKKPPEILYHGTGSKSVQNIMWDGLKKMSRHHVHLSSDIETAKAVGQRHGRPVVLQVESGDMYEMGYKFYRTDNGVWLVDNVPSHMLRILK
jgi:putative RNA 2'-phosphotransferase